LKFPGVALADNVNSTGLKNCKEKGLKRKIKRKEWRDEEEKEASNSHSSSIQLHKLITSI
jgi:hypothetical protein